MTPLPMSGKEVLGGILSSYYAGTDLLNYSESDDEIRFRVPAPLRDTQVFRSRAPVLNELAVSHRLSLLVGRSKYGLPDDVAFAIQSVETVAHGVDVVDEHDLSLRFEVMTRRRDAITALRTTLATKHGGQARMTTTSFNVLPPSLANFVRRTRQFQDFADVKIRRAESCLSAVADGHFRYDPSESDRLSDGRRVDHVPALILIDIALFVDSLAHQGAVHSNISAEFLNYTDPRLAFDILRNKDHGALELVQNGRLVAIVRQAREEAPA